jgi:hypothetical protein
VSAEQIYSSEDPDFCKIFEMNKMFSSDACRCAYLDVMW